MDAVPTSAQDSSSGANASSIKSEDNSPRHDGGRGSPPPNCAICLGTCRNKSFTDSCLHQFCFKCLLTWSKVKAECPLCKQNFRSIIHNVRSNHQYEEYMVEQRQTEEIAESFASATRRFRYRTTLTLPRRETIAIQQLLLRYPMMADVFPAPAHRRRSPASFRRTVYRYNLWARLLPDFTGRFRDCTPEFYRYNESQTTRLVPWLNRELQYLLNENVGHISYVISRILLLLPQYHINSSEFRNALRRYFGDRTDHFLHELYCFASTPYDMTGYDRNVQYTTDPRVSTMVNEVLSSSDSDASVDSDIVMISSSGPPDPPPGPSRVPAPVYPHHYINEPTSSNVPAPASAPASVIPSAPALASVVPPAPVPSSSNVIPIETISQSDTDDDSSEVMVVGYIKPPQDRTPEVVDLLGSDSDVIVQDSAPSPPAAREDAQESRAAALVMLTLRSHSARRQDSDSDSTYTPSPPALSAQPSQRRRRCSRHSATTADTRRTTPTPPPSPSLSTRSPLDSHFQTSSPSIVSTIRTPSLTTTSVSNSSHDSTEYSDSSECESRPRKKRRLASYKSRSKRRWTPPQRKASRHVNEKKGKSSSGRGVKTSKIAEPAPAEEEQPAPLDRAGPSGASVGTKRRRMSRESKRLRSVVNVINSQRNSGESSSNSRTGSNLRKSDRRTDKKSKSKRAVDFDDSDSEDDLPLNLTVGTSL